MRNFGCRGGVASRYTDELSERRILRGPVNRFRRPTLPLLSALFALATTARLAAAQEPVPIAPAEAPRAHPSLLRALDAGAETVRVIVGVADGTPSARTLRFSPDPAGEPQRRIRRLEFQRRISKEMPEEEFRVRHFYPSFSLLSGTATRAGALALANRPDVLWVAVDGKRKPLEVEAQNAQVLIGSDQANALGFTGLHQTIAVLDTGVDYSHVALGGGGFPNAKVIGGADTADNDNDPMDCEGHGTSVAAIAAGPTGVAPDAKIVAVKVFPSTSSTNASCEDSADDSVILAGIDWVLTNRESLGIGVMNLSLGGAYDDTLDHGYCDADVPAYTEAFDSAIAAGITVVVASGNDGTSNAIAAPACVSSAISVGAVYSQTGARQTWLDDEGGVQCEDAPTAPDQVVCFSNSSTALSMLAPGAFWVVAQKGQGSNLFAGTSAASPAVAGAAALLRQARPAASPAALASILRSTGKPITDPRNGIATPRLDAMAAVSLDATRLFAFVGAATPIPDGAGSANASVTVAGFAGGVAGLEVVVEIDHSDPQQLRVTLTGPDGTRVVLHDRTGQHEHPINAIYGKLDAPAQSLAAFQGRAPNGVWTLTVEDRVTGVAGRIRNFAVLLHPGQPAVAIPANVAGRVVPVVAHFQGSRFFQSDLHVFNPAATPREFSLYFVPDGLTGAQAVRSTRTIGPGQVLAISDVVSAEYGFSASKGPIVATSAAPGFLTSGRLYTNTLNGSFGHIVPGFATSQGLAPGGGTAAANGLIKSEQFHSNVGFTEVSGSTVQVRVDVLDGAGALLGGTTIVAGGNTTPIFGDIVQALGLPPMPSFRANFTVLSPTGRIIPFATYVDDFTGDTIFQPALNPAPSAEDLILTQSAHVSGARGDFFTTNVYLSNLDTQPVAVTVSLIPQVLTGTPASPRVFNLGPGETLAKTDILVSEFGLADPSVAGLRIRPDRPARLVVTNNTFVPKFGGTSGYSVQALPASRAAGAGKTVTAIGLSQSPLATGFRCNFGFIEVGGADVVVRVTARSGATGAVLGWSDFPLAANRLAQANSSMLLGGSGAAVDNFYLQYSVVSGSGRIFAYATVNDNTSGDAIYVQAE
jgi:subtilisin-like proprotein convertase family protein